MNERLKELAHEAGLVTYNPAGIPTKLEKFAELIVKECAKIAFQNDIAKFTKDGMKIGFEIEKHFGVES